MTAQHVSSDIIAHHQELLNGNYSFWFYCLSLPAAVQYAVSTHSRHQPAATWANTTRYCKYNQVLLMMGENIAQNMYS
jgi:hypothetical protein